MRSIVHLSDLHTGRLDSQVLAALAPTIRAVNPHLVVISGDLTQRATRTQFREARGFLDALDAPLLIIPGNHDVPLWNVARRFVTPLARYKEFRRRHPSRKPLYYPRRDRWTPLPAEFSLR